MNEEAVRGKLVVWFARFDAGGLTSGELADALLPVVREMAAEELREAAEEAHDEYSGWEAADVVRARADALTKPGTEVKG